LQLNGIGIFLFLKTGSGRPDDIINVTKKTIVFLSTLAICGDIHELQKAEQRDWYTNSESKRNSAWALLLSG